MKLLVKVIVQVVYSVSGNDTERIWIQHQDISVKAVDSGHLFYTQSCEFQLLTVLCCSFIQNKKKTIQ